MDTKIKAQLYDLVSLANTEDSSKLVDIGNLKIREEDFEKYQELQRQLDIIKPENQELPLTNFPGTNVPKPRFRNYNESNEEYIQFLQEYYSVYFPETKTVKKETSEITAEEELTSLASISGEEITMGEIGEESDVMEETEAFEVETALADISGEEITMGEIGEESDVMEETEAFEVETPLSSFTSEESEIEDVETSGETDLTDEELEAMYDDMIKNLSEKELVDENFDILEESEIISIKEIPKKLWEKIKAIPFIKKSIDYLEKLVTKTKKSKNTALAEIDSEVSIEEFEQKKDTYKEAVQHRASDEDLKNDSKSEYPVDYNVDDTIDKIIINGVEPLTSSFTSPKELFSKVDNGSAYNYSDLERSRIENIKDTINPEMNGFFISGIIKKNEDGSIDNVQSANTSDLEHLIFEISNRDIPDYVFARYSGKNIKESLINQDKVSPKAM